MTKMGQETLGGFQHPLNNLSRTVLQDDVYFEVDNTTHEKLLIAY